MKYIIYILFIGYNTVLQSQTINEEKVFFDIVDQISYSENSEIGYFKKVDSGMLNYNLKKFEKLESLTYSMYQRNTKLTDSIKLSPKEKTYLIDELRASVNYEWNLKKKNKLMVVENNSPLSIQDFLMKDRNRELKIISKPIFIRDNSIVCIFSAHLCCGHIYGHTSLSFYKIIDGKWTEWIAILRGDF